MKIKRWELFLLFLNTFVSSPIDVWVMYLNDGWLFWGAAFGLALAWVGNLLVYLGYRGRRKKLMGKMTDKLEPVGSEAEKSQVLPTIVSH